ncbi:Hypothetical predicted protein, partial [Pelobates cultripes]
MYCVICTPHGMHGCSEARVRLYESKELHSQDWLYGYSKKVPWNYAAAFAQMCCG